MSDYNNLPSRDRRVKSAKARLTPQAHEINATSEKFSKMSMERISSAKSIKNKHSSSARAFVAGRPSTTAKGKERFTTMYAQDFDGRFVRPPEVRPTSPTRRNNPHPSKQFMAWKVPSREIGVVPYEEGLDLPPEHIAQRKDLEETDGLLSLKHLHARPTSTEYGAYLHRNLSSRHGGKPKQVGDALLRHVITDGNEDALAEWLEAASQDEQQTVLKMLKSAEEEKIKQTILSVMKPEAADGVHGWLKGADDIEKEVALRLFSSLGSHQNRRMRSRSLGHLDVVRLQSREPVPPPFPPPLPRPSLSAVGSSQGMRARGVRPHPVGVWHHKSVRDPPPKVYHRGSVFGGVRENASHFNIHPEWPDYYGDSRNPVH